MIDSQRSIRVVDLKVGDLVEVDTYSGNTYFFEMINPASAKALVWDKAGKIEKSEKLIGLTDEAFAMNFTKEHVEEADIVAGRPVSIEPIDDPDGGWLTSAIKVCRINGEVIFEIELSE